jgi:di/tricarboxylate transporter
MSADAAITLAVVLITVIALVREMYTPDLAMLGALTVLTLLGVISVEEALVGFANPALFAIAALFVVAAGLRATGALETVGGLLFGRGRSLRRVLLRLTSVTAAMSAFLNNTAIVAMGTPSLVTWSRRHGFSPSKLLIPLSFAALLGGICTLIGTATNLVADGLLRAHGMTGLAFFELAPIGIACAVLGVVYLTLLGPRLIPERIGTERRTEEAREYTVELSLYAPSSLIGKSVEAAGLRHLPGLFLVRIERDISVESRFDRTLMSPVTPDVVLQAGDRLTFAGSVDTIRDLRRFRGLQPTPGERVEPGENGGWRLHEAVVSHGSPLVGSSIREASFRARYGAAVIAVHRHGERIEGRIGDIDLRPGDALLLEAAPGFERAFSSSPDFYLVSSVEDSDSPRFEHGLRALVILAAVVIASVLNLVPLALAAVAGAIAMVLSRCISVGEARQAVNWGVVVMIAASLGIGTALETSGAAQQVAEQIISIGQQFGALGILAAVYVVALVLTQLIMNAATAALMFPIAVSAAASQGLDPRPFVIAVTVAASLSLATPISHQTNLMVYGPGGYKFSDFARVGMPLQVMLGVISVALIPMLWPLVAG